MNYKYVEFVICVDQLSFCISNDLYENLLNKFSPYDFNVSIC